MPAPSIGGIMAWGGQQKWVVHAPHWILALVIRSVVWKIRLMVRGVSSNGACAIKHDTACIMCQASSIKPQASCIMFFIRISKRRCNVDHECGRVQGWESVCFKIFKQRNLKMCGTHIGPYFRESQFSNFPKSYFFKICWICSWIIWCALVSPKINHSGFGAQGHVQKPWNHRNDGFVRQI